MGNYLTITQSNFNWDFSEEPHKSRRIEILNKYPEIKKLMRKDGDRFRVLEGIAIFVLHISCGCLINYFFDQCRPMKTFLVACIGPWFATLLMLHVHEASHSMVFGPNHVWKNRLYGYFVNVLLINPIYAFFKRQHKNHHKYIGDEILDAEYPSEIEAKLFNFNPVTKWLWFLINPVVFNFRTPLLVVKNFQWEINAEEMFNIVINEIFNVCLLYNGYIDLLVYLMFSQLLATESHMFGFWGVSSHIEFLKGKETSSYYGWMNRIFLNFGYHMEHHDFPSVPSRYLPEITRIAPEYYDDSFTLDSFYSAVIKFLFDPNLGVRSKLKRPTIDEKYVAKCKDKDENFRKFQ